MFCEKINLLFVWYLYNRFILYINEIIIVKLCVKENSCRLEIGIVLNKII